MQMTGYELLANYEKAEDKDKQIQILADLNHIPVDMVCFVIDNSEKFDTSEAPLSTEEFTGIDVHDISNLMPSCGSCNRYKSTMDLETFRKQLQKIPDRLKRDVCTYNIAVRFGMVQENREPIKFYFEKVGESDAN